MSTNTINAINADFNTFQSFWWEMIDYHTSDHPGFYLLLFFCFHLFKLQYRFSELGYFKFYSYIYIYIYYFAIYIYMKMKFYTAIKI